MTNLDSIYKSRDITLSTKVHLVTGMVFLVAMYSCESWTPKEGWAPKNWCFWTVVLEKTLENPLDCREIQPVNPKGNQPWIFMMLKLQYFGHLLWRANLLEKTLRLGKIEGKRITGDRKESAQLSNWTTIMLSTLHVSLSRIHFSTS